MNEFDLDRYLRASRRLDLTGIEWDRVKEHALSPEEARCLTYMMDIESHTSIYLRDLLATRAAHEPDITAFLSCWAYEELWHGEALSRFLGEAGVPIPPDGERPTGEARYPTRIARNGAIRRARGKRGYAGHLVTMVGSAAIPDFAALHMTWGAVNELSTLTGYTALIEKSSHPILIELLERIIKDERRHFALYRSQARMRLARSGAARRITRWAIEHFWAPVGTGVRPREETDFVVSWLFGDRRGARTAHDMDRTIGELPGFAGTTVVRRARTAAIARAARFRPQPAPQFA